MLNLQQVNDLIDAALTSIELRVPKMKLSIGDPEPVRTPGVYGSVIMNALFTGQVEGKLTFTMEWGTGLQIAEALAGVKIEGFNEVAQQALESLFQEMLQLAANKFAETGTAIDIRLLPTLVDTSVLLAEEGKSGALKIPIVTDSGTISLYLAFK